MMIEWSWVVCFFNQRAAYEMRISDWSSDVCSSDLGLRAKYEHQRSMRKKMIVIWATVARKLEAWAWTLRECQLERPRDSPAPRIQREQLRDAVSGVGRKRGREIRGNW